MSVVYNLGMHFFDFDICEIETFKFIQIIENSLLVFEANKYCFNYVNNFWIVSEDTGSDEELKNSTRPISGYLIKLNWLTTKN